MRFAIASNQKGMELWRLKAVPETSEQNGHADGSHSEGDAIEEEPPVKKQRKTKKPVRALSNKDIPFGK